MYLHTHGLVFRNVTYGDTLNFNSRIRKIIPAGEFMD